MLYRHATGRTLGEADNTAFSTMTMNPQPLHLDGAASAQTEFGERLVNSPLTTSVLVGLSVGHLTQGPIVANLGCHEATFPAPVRHGDTIYGETVVEEKRHSASRPGQGVVRFRHIARNQHRVVVAVVGGPRSCGVLRRWTSEPDAAAWARVALLPGRTPRAVRQGPGCR